MVNVSNLISLSEHEVSRFLLALVLLLSAAHLFGYTFAKFSLPRVIGEIFAGLVLGPSLLGAISPGTYTWIFNAFEVEGRLIAAIYWLGLVLLMFISGFEINRSFNKQDRKIIVAILTGGTLVPFIAGWFFPNLYNIQNLLGVAQSYLALQIVISIAIAITSIPVISKIFIDLGIMQTRFAKIVIAAATIEDVLLWVALAVASSIVTSQSVSLGHILQTVLLTIVFLAIGLLLLPKVLEFIDNLRINLFIKSSVLGYALLIGFALTVLASILDVNVIFGALVAGLVIGSQQDKRYEEVKAIIKQFSLAFFIPIYFAVVGLKLNLVRDFDIWFFSGFLLFAMACKLFGTILSAKAANLNWLSSLNLGMAMNARGGPGIVLATVALDMGIINERFFASLIMLAIVTSLIAGYWFKWVLSKSYSLLQ